MRTRILSRVIAAAQLHRHRESCCVLADQIDQGFNIIVRPRREMVVSVAFRLVVESLHPASAGSSTALNPPTTVRLERRDWHNVVGIHRLTPALRPSNWIALACTPAWLLVHAKPGRCFRHVEAENPRIRATSG